MSYISTIPKVPLVLTYAPNTIQNKSCDLKLLTVLFGAEVVYGNTEACDPLHVVVKTVGRGVDLTAATIDG